MGTFSTSYGTSVPALWLWSVKLEIVLNIYAGNGILILMESMTVANHR
jgi:hypothetical protein